MCKTARQQDDDKESELYGTAHVQRRITNGDLAAGASSAKGSGRAAGKRKISVSSEFKQAIYALRQENHAPQQLELKSAKSASATLSGLEKIVDEVIENRKDLIDGQKRKSGYLKSGEKSGITRQFGKVELVSADAAEPSRIDSSRPAPAAGRELETDERRATQKIATAIKDAFDLVLNLLGPLKLPDEPLPTMLWTPETHRTIFEYSIKAPASYTNPADGHWNRTEFREDNHAGKVIPIKRPKLRRTLEQPANLVEISIDAQNRLTSILAEASHHYGHREFAKGDAAVERALHMIAISAMMEPGTVAILPLILASAGNVVFLREENRNAGRPDGNRSDASTRYSLLARLGLERQPEALDADQISHMAKLAERAALRAADQLFASEAMYLVKTDATERLAEGLQQVAREAVQNRWNRIDQASVEAIANETARFGATHSLILLIVASLNQAIQREARETLQRAIRETAATLPDSLVVLSCPGCGAEW